MQQLFKQIEMKNMEAQRYKTAAEVAKVLTQQYWVHTVKSFKFVKSTNFFFFSANKKIRGHCERNRLCM